MTPLEWANKCSKEIRDRMFPYGLKKGEIETLLADTIKAAVEEEREACAQTCVDAWKNASNGPPNYRQNEISHGCIASAKAIRARSELAGTAPNGEPSPIEGERLEQGNGASAEETSD